MSKDIEEVGTPRPMSTLPEQHHTEEGTFSSQSPFPLKKALSRKEEFKALQEAMQNDPRYEVPDEEGNFEDENAGNDTAGEDIPVHNYSSAPTSAAANTHRANPDDSLEKTGDEQEEGSFRAIDIKQCILRGSFLPVMLLLQRGLLSVDQVWEPTVGT